MQQDLYMIVLNNFQEKPFDYVWFFSESKKKILQISRCSGWVGDVYILNHKKPFSTHFRDWGFGPDAHYVLLLNVSCSYTCLVHSGSTHVGDVSKTNFKYYDLKNFMYR